MEPPTKSYIAKFVDVLAALKSGKLPSQEQINDVLRRVISSHILEDEDFGSSPEEKERRRLLSRTREFVEATLVVGSEKNGEYGLRAPAESKF